MIKRIFSLTLLFLLVSCSSYRPILDQNSKYLEAGEKKSEEDIEICKTKSEEYLKKYKAQRALRDAGRQALFGGILGGITGAIWGRTGKSTLIGSAIGAVAGATLSGISSAGSDKIKPDQIKQNYISNCLAREGYSVIGWY